MTPYRTIYPEFWTGPTGKKIKAQGVECQLLAVYLMTCKHAHPTGLFYIPSCFMSHETGIGIEETSRALAALCSREIDFCEYDDTSEWIWVKNMARFQLDPELKPGDKRIKWVEKALEQAIKAAPKLTGGFIAKYQEPYNLSLSLTNPLSPIKAPKEPQKKPQEKPLRRDIKAPSKPENREQRTENREQRTESTKYSDGLKPDAGLDVAGEIIEFANELEDIPKSISTIATSKLRAVITARIKDGYNPEHLKGHLCRYVERKRAHTWYLERYSEDPPKNSRFWCPNVGWRLIRLFERETLDTYYSTWKNSVSLTEGDLLGIRQDKENLSFIGSYHPDTDSKPFTDDLLEQVYFRERHYERILQQQMKDSMKRSVGA